MIFFVEVARTVEPFFKELCITVLLISSIIYADIWHVHIPVIQHTCTCILHVCKINVKKLGNSLSITEYSVVYVLMGTYMYCMHLYESSYTHPLKEALTQYITVA